MNCAIFISDVGYGHMVRQRQIIFNLKKEFKNLKNISRDKEFKIPKKFADFKKLFNSDNFNRLNCIFLPFDAVIKALKL